MVGSEHPVGNLFGLTEMFIFSESWFFVFESLKGKQNASLAN